MADKGILREFFGSLSADVITKYFLPNVFKKSGEKIDQAFEKRLDEECRKTFAFMVSQMPEPWRTKMNEHYRQATKTHIENKMARLLVKAVEGRKEDEQQEYFMYVSMLDWDKPRKDDATGDIYPSVLEELDKLDHDPIPEFFEWSLEKIKEHWPKVCVAAGKADQVIDKGAREAIRYLEPEVDEFRRGVVDLTNRVQARRIELQKRRTKRWRLY